MERYLATGIISIDKKAAVGDIVELKTEPDNAVDSNAIAIYKDGVHIGYLANKERTIRPGTKAAASYVKMMTNPRTGKVYGRLMDEVMVKKEKVEQQTFVVSLYFAMNYAATPVTPYTFDITGGAVVAPGITELKRRLLEEHDTETVTIKRQNRSTTIQILDTAGVVSGLVRVSSSGEDGDEFAAKLEKLERALDDGPCEGTVSITNRNKILLSVVFASGEEALHNAMDGVVSRCVEQVDEINEKVKFMQEARLSNVLIAKVLDTYRRYDDDNEARIPHPEFPFCSTSTDGMDVLNRAMVYHINGKHIRLVGEKGCGKNTLIETVCWLMRRPLYRLSGSSDMDKTDLIGAKTIEDGTMSYELTDFLRTLEAGGDVDLDEANTIKPDIAVLIHSLTDTTRAIEIPGYGRVTMDPLASFWMTMNEDYVGTGDMNDATIDRFVTLRLKAESNIKSLLKERVPTATDEALNFCQKVYADIKKAIHEGTLTATCVSIRGMIDALECCAFLPVSTALEDTLASKPQDPDERETLKGIIANHCG